MVKWMLRECEARSYKILHCHVIGAMVLFKETHVDLILHHTWESQICWTLHLSPWILSDCRANCFTTHSIIQQMWIPYDRRCVYIFLDCTVVTDHVLMTALCLEGFVWTYSEATFPFAVTRFMGNGTLRGSHESESDITSRCLICMLRFVCVCVCVCGVSAWKPDWFNYCIHVSSLMTDPLCVKIHDFSSPYEVGRRVCLLPHNI